MNNLNQALLEGNVTDDVQLFFTDKGKPYCTFTIESNRFLKRGDEEYSRETAHFNLRAEGQLAENFVEQCKKGRTIRVIGRLAQAQDRSVYILCEHIVYKPSMKGVSGE